MEADKRAEAERVKRQVEETNRAIQEEKQKREAQEKVMKYDPTSQRWGAG